jgi:hypothetical protein
VTPTPGPTDLPWDATLEPWWPWLTEVAIPTAGVLASTAVAVAALLVSRRAAAIAAAAHRSEERREQADDRTAFAADLVAWIDDQREVMRLRNRLASNPQALRLRAVALGAKEITDWVAAAFVVLQAIKPAATRRGDAAEGRRLSAVRLNGVVALRKDAESRLAGWIAGEYFDDTPFELRK